MTDCRIYITTFVLKTTTRTTGCFYSSETRSLVANKVSIQKQMAVSEPRTHELGLKVAKGSVPVTPQDYAKKVGKAGKVLHARCYIKHSENKAAEAICVEGREKKKGTN